MKSLKFSERALGAFLTAILGQESFVAARAPALGCMLGWVRILVATGSTSLSRAEAANHAVLAAGLRGLDFEALLAELSALRLIELDGERVRLPALAAALQASSLEHERRKAGWVRRKTSSPEKGKPSEDADTQPEGKPPGAGALAPGVVNSSKQRRIDPVRMGVSDADATPIVARVTCRDGAVEATEAFASALQNLHPRVDVIRELQLAARWCQDHPERRKTVRGMRAFVSSWMRRSSERHDINAAVIAANRRGNGFGAGGAYVSVGTSKQDDFADLFA